MMTVSTRFGRWVVIALAATIIGCNYSVNDDIAIPEGASHSGDGNTINGNVEVGADADASDSKFSTINGSIVVKDGARVSDCATVNGELDIGDRSEAGNLRAVNGDLTIGRDALIEGRVQLVNGSVSLKPGSRVNGDVGTVNGLIELRSAEVEGDLSNVNGGMRIVEGSLVEGDVTVKEEGDDRHGEPPRIVIGRDSRVTGKLVFERQVELFVHDSAKIGEVSGADVIRFSGDEPG